MSLPLDALSGLVLTCLAIGFTIAVIVLDTKKYNGEEEYEESCTKSRHVFKHDETKSQLYCFCGSESFSPSINKQLFYIKT